VLKVSAVTNFEYLPEESKPVPAGYAPPDSHFVKEGDLLFSRANTAQLIGATAFVHTNHTKRILPDKIWRFVWRDPQTVEPLFVWFLFRQPSVRRALAQLSTGTSGSMKNISQDKVLGLKVGWPPHSKQKRFAVLLSSIMKEKRSITNSMAKFEAGFQALQHRAFRGEL
jgi:type I restriction enzyme, S subunit